MIITAGLENLPSPPQPSEVAIGTFDGVHRGHRTIIETAVRESKHQSLQSVVLTFDHHPFELLFPDRMPGYLTTPEQRNYLVAKTGAERLVIAQFNRPFADLHPDQFLKEVVVGKIGAIEVVVGSNFRFGHRQSGDVKFLNDHQQELGYRARVINSVCERGDVISSTRIRNLIRHGEIGKAEWLLGHPFVLDTVVVNGEGLGCRLGYPTANLRPTIGQVIPADGVYAALVKIDNRRYMAAGSIGERATMGGKERVIEMHLLDFEGDLYQRRLQARFIQRIRGQVKFDTVDQLTKEIGNDVKETRRILSGWKVEAIAEEWLEEEVEADPYC
ncbi:MAG: bifunctional riboflavin kinase/FAD synthetase [Armatimonadetes bacterium]|nr:bifunctional riboflavin kinase/FAD synthetase [Armatimonadota bacterium]